MIQRDRQCRSPGWTTTNGALPRAVDPTAGFGRNAAAEKASLGPERHWEIDQPLRSVEAMSVCSKQLCEPSPSLSLRICPDLPAFESCRSPLLEVECLQSERPLSLWLGKV